ncbi:hypothetical protein ACJX0J_017973, partial [Zea mays]
MIVSWCLLYLEKNDLRVQDNLLVGGKGQLPLYGDCTFLKNDKDKIWTRSILTTIAFFDATVGAAAAAGKANE